MVSTTTMTTPSCFAPRGTAEVAGSAATSPLLSQLFASSEAAFTDGVSVTPCTPPPTVSASAVGATPPRRSERFGVALDGASAIDEDSLKKAMRRKAARNLDNHGTNLSSKSFLSFSSNSIHSKLSSVGVNLGSSKNQVDVSTKVLRHMEFDRLTVIPKVSTGLTATYIDEEEANATSDGQLLSHLIGEVLEGGLDDDGLSSLYELKASGRKSKSTTNKSRKRAKLSKSPTVFQ